MTWSPGRWGTTEVHLPANLHREETREHIEAYVKQLLAQTDEWPVVIGCPHGGREVSPDTLRWLVEYRTAHRARYPLAVEARSAPPSSSVGSMRVRTAVAVVSSFIVVKAAVTWVALNAWASYPEHGVRSPLACRAWRACGVAGGSRGGWRGYRRALHRGAGSQRSRRRASRRAEDACPVGAAIRRDGDWPAGCVVQARRFRTAACHRRRPCRCNVERAPRRALGTAEESLGSKGSAGDLNTSPDTYAEQRCRGHFRHTGLLRDPLLASNGGSTAGSNRAAHCEIAGTELCPD